MNVRTVSYFKEFFSKSIVTNFDRHISTNKTISNCKVSVNIQNSHVKNFLQIKPYSNLSAWNLHKRLNTLGYYSRPTKFASSLGYNILYYYRVPFYGHYQDNQCQPASPVMNKRILSVATCPWWWQSVYGLDMEKKLDFSSTVLHAQSPYLHTFSVKLGTVHKKHPWNLWLTWTSANLVYPHPSNNLFLTNNCSWKYPLSLKTMITVTNCWTSCIRQQTDEQSCWDATLVNRLPCHNQSSTVVPDYPTIPHSTADLVCMSSDHPILIHAVHKQPSLRIIHTHVTAFVNLQ